MGQFQPEFTQYDHLLPRSALYSSKLDNTPSDSDGDRVRAVCNVELGEDVL
jgi:hypothetical protein